MSEKLSNDQLREVLNPRNTPALGIQTYEYLGGEKGDRESQKQAFIAGEIVNPALSYPKLDISIIDAGINELETILNLADKLEDDDRDVVWDSTAYRMAEHYWLKSAARLNLAAHSGNEALIRRAAEEYQRLNEQLYGIPSAELGDMIFGEVYAQIANKSLGDLESSIYKELEDGFCVDVNGMAVTVEPLGKPSIRLPEISMKVLERLKAKHEEKFSDIHALVDDYFNQHIITRPENERVFTPDDLYSLFSAALELRDPENTSGVRVVIDNNATALSWDTPQMSVVVGGSRKPISDPQDVKAKIDHEFGWHGGRAIIGSASRLPILGSGLYTEADPGEQSDYLTFEEGIASLGEKALNPKKSKWVPIDIERSAALSLAYKGYDFRQAYETLWRIRVLMLAKDDKETSPENIAIAKRNAYDTCVRIFRGTPTSLSRNNEDGTFRVITYNKDLAYLSGKLIAANFLETSTDEDLELALTAKYDPTNKRQLAIVRKYMGDTIKR